MRIAYLHDMQYHHVYIRHNETCQTSSSSMMLAISVMILIYHYSISPSGCNNSCKMIAVIFMYDCNKVIITTRVMSYMIAILYNCCSNGP